MIEFESVLDTWGVNGGGGVVEGANSGGESIKVGGGLSSISSVSIESSPDDIAGVVLDLLAAAVQGGGDREVIPGCVGTGAGSI